MNHTQLLSRNHVEFAEMISVFHDLNSVYDNQFTLYLDMDGWELFDVRTARTIFRRPFNQFRHFTSDMIKLRQDMINVGTANIRVNRQQRPNKNESWSIKSLLKFYSLQDYYLFNKNLQNYINYGKL